MTWSKDLIENITDIGELEAKLRFDRRLTQIVASCTAGIASASGL